MKTSRVLDIIVFYMIKKDHLSIIIVNTQPVPSSGVGAASVNRILSYAKGLVNVGNSVRIISTAGNGNIEWSEYEGVAVKHLGTPVKSVIQRLLGHIRTSVRLIRTLKGEKKDVVLFVTSNYPLTILLEFYCKLSRTKIVNERSEYPFVLMTNNRMKRLIAPLYTNTAYKLLDGMIIMTKPLMEYYAHKVGKKCRFLEVPMTVDTKRFEVADGGGACLEGSDYIAYCGNMGGNKDGLKDLIHAFSIVEKRGYSLNLLLIGGTNNKSEYDELISLNESLGNNNVVFYGKADRDSMPALLKGAKMLVLARPSSMQSTGGFPTKLGEYLSTGNPVVVTAVGDIPYYLKNKENAYVVPPDDVQAFADAICYVWDHYEEAKLVGNKGKELTKTVFSGEYQAKRIEGFLKELIIGESS